jgi:hypothetical protein
MPDYHGYLIKRAMTPMQYLQLRATDKSTWDGDRQQLEHVLRLIDSSRASPVERGLGVGAVGAGLGAGLGSGVGFMLGRPGLGALVGGGLGGAVGAGLGAKAPSAARGSLQQIAEGGKVPYAIPTKDNKFIKMVNTGLSPDDLMMLKELLASEV